MHRQALVGARIFDGESLHDGKALVLRSGIIEGLVEVTALGPSISRSVLQGGVLSPGFIDAQVNGGGGLMLNDAPKAETMFRMAAAHLGSSMDRAAAEGQARVVEAAM